MKITEFKNPLKISGLFLLGIFLFTGFGKKSTPLHTLPVKSIEDVRAFFRYTGTPQMPIISGHRGCRENHCPENSIRAYEYTLENVPAFFEIDPRLTKDSVIIIMHDPTLERTTTGTGKIEDHTWAELKNLRLKDMDGHVTDEKIPTLDDVIRWSKGKTVINLDVYTPKEALAKKLREYHFPPNVMLTIHTPEQAQFYHEQSSKTMFSIHIKTVEQLEAFEKTGILWENVIAYVGPRMLPENQELYNRLHAKGVRCMISLAPTYDTRKTPEERREGYLSDREILPDIIESDFPVELTQALQSLKK
ncbi:MAG: glycerophosphodiester phosphodiesterase family protein [Tannerella sp.]|jgi:glycerophosphoryl diester phosphodiesterase|nr:glycerophosphodiester phosphodiesterase family protein [Tannerella sp.]